MKTKEEFQKQIDFMQNLLNELKENKELYKEIEEWPKHRDDYFSISTNGTVDKRIWYDTENDNGRKKVGNIHRTKEDAEWALGVVKANAYLRSMNDGYEFEVVEDNWYIFYNNSIGCLDNSVLQEFFFNCLIYFKTTKAAQKAIDNMPTDLKKYLMPRDKQ